MKKSFQKILIASSLALAAVTSIAVITPSIVAAAGTTNYTIQKGHSTVLTGASTYVVTSGTSVVSVSSSGWLTALNYGSATVKGYNGSGVLVWTWYVTVN